MGAMASQITGLTIVYSTVHSKLHVTGLCAGNSPVTGVFPHKEPATRKMFPFDDAIVVVIELQENASVVDIWEFLHIFCCKSTFSIKYYEAGFQQLPYFYFFRTYSSARSCHCKQYTLFAKRNGRFFSDTNIDMISHPICMIWCIYIYIHVCNIY